MDIHSARQQLRTHTIYDLPLRVTFYARVSSESDEQLNSLGNQISYYRDYISRKYMNIMNCTDELDEKLNSISMGWKTSRMNRVDLTVLRLAVYELEYEKEEVPVGVAINEAVELAKCFGSEESGAFVNGILGKIANPDKKVAARKASSKKEEQTSARPKSGFKVKDPSKKVVVVNRNVSSRAPENKNE